MTEDAVAHWLRAVSHQPVTVSDTLPQPQDDMTIVQFPPGAGRDTAALRTADPSTADPTGVTVAVVDPSTEIDLMVDDWPEPGSTFVTLRHSPPGRAEAPPAVGAPGGGRGTGATGPVDTSRTAAHPAPRWGWSRNGMSMVRDLLQRVGAVRAAELVAAVEQLVQTGSGRTLMTVNDLYAVVLRGHNGIHRTTAYDKERPDSRLTTYHGWMYLANPWTPAMAATLRPGTMISLPGFAQASADPATIVGAAVGVALFGTALDLSEAHNQPPGTILLIMPGRFYAVTDIAQDTANAVRITLMG
jgi:hypothetical protein